MESVLTESAETRALLGEILSKTDSELLLFFALLVVALVAAVPLYRLMAKHRLELERQRASREAARVNQVLTVVNSNTEAVRELKGLIGALTARNESDHARLAERIGEVAARVSTPRVSTRVRRVK
jgi:hypothetical protein